MESRQNLLYVRHLKFNNRRKGDNVKQAKELGNVYDDMCDMVEEATKIRDDALRDLDTEEQKATDSIDYWGGKFVQAVAAKDMELINSRREAILNEFDRIEELSVKIQDFVASTLTNMDTD
jgi:L-lactate utilization protein LutB